MPACQYCSPHLAPVAVALLISLAPFASAQNQTTAPEVLVTASRIGVPAGHIGSAYSVITGEELEAGGAVYVADALRGMPGLAVNRAGGVGAITQIRMRGAEGNHVLVLVDGIEVSDPVLGEFDFSALLSRNIDRIEILRGPQSAVWGSNALAGVINIITRKAEAGMQGAMNVEGGSFSSLHTQGSLYFGDDRARAAINVKRFTTNGETVSRFGGERDGDRNLSASFKGDFDVTPALNLEGVMRYTKRAGEFDPQDFAFPPTATNGLVVDGFRENRVNDIAARATAGLKLLNDRWQSKLNASYNAVVRDTLSATALTAGTDANRDTLNLVSSFQFDTPALGDIRHTLTGSVERKSESFANTAPAASPDQRQRRDRTLYGFVGEYRLDAFDRLHLSGALRYDDNDAFNDVYTFRATGAFVLHETGTRLHASVGRGVTNPTFFEQFGFTPSLFDGNPNLKPERSLGWDVGVEQAFLERRLVLDATYFHADLKDEIVTTFDFATFRSSVANLTGSSRRHGIEVSMTAYPTPDLDLRASYTWTSSRDATGAREVRRPRHTGGVDATYRFLADRARATVGVTYNGRVEDLEFVAATPETRATLDAYTLVSLSGAYDISDNLRWTGRVENLLDETYEEVFSFRSPGLAAYTGLELTFGD